MACGWCRTYVRVVPYMRGIYLFHVHAGMGVVKETDGWLHAQDGIIITWSLGLSCACRSGLKTHSASAAQSASLVLRRQP